MTTLKKDTKEIEVIQFNGDNAVEIYNFIYPNLTHIVGSDDSEVITIYAHSGTIEAVKGDYIIKGDGIISISKDKK